MKKTLIIGATTNPDRFAYKATMKLVKYGHSVFLLGQKKGEVCNVEIQSQLFSIDNLHTVTMYVRPDNQEMYYDYILSLKPHRVIFNPGTENPDFYKILKKNNIIVEEECILVMLSLGIY